MITTGVTGRTWRASITPWGAIEPWDGSAPLDWFVAADDRWHVPADEPTVRQRRLDGTAVVETRVRVPTGDVVQRIASVADGPGYTVVEVENDSTLPVAVAFGRRDLRTERPVSELPDVPGLGLDLPPTAFAVPVGHRAVARVALAHDGSGAGPLPSLPSAMQVARGWLALAERASRLVVPDAGLGEAVVAERCEAALGAIPDVGDDPAGFALAVGELVRLGEPAEPWLPDVAHAVELVARQPGWRVDAALVATARVVATAGDDRARRDLARVRRRRDDGRRAAPDRPGGGRPAEQPPGVAVVAWAEQRLVDGGMLLPDGLPTSWLGANFEVYGVPAGDDPATTVSFALRWHGERPAVLWEVDGGPIELTSPVLAPGWLTTEPTGETLWPQPRTGP